MKTITWILFIFAEYTYVPFWVVFAFKFLTFPLWITAGSLLNMLKEGVASAISNFGSDLQTSIVCQLQLWNLINDKWDTVNYCSAFKIMLKLIAWVLFDKSCQTHSYFWAYQYEDISIKSKSANAFHFAILFCHAIEHEWLKFLAFHVTNTQYKLTVGSKS